MNEPSLVPVATMRSQAVSSATTTSSIARWKSENARFSDPITALHAIGARRVVGPEVLVLDEVGRCELVGDRRDRPR